MRESLATAARVASCIVAAAAVSVAPAQARDDGIEAQLHLLRRAAEAVVGLRAEAVEGARSAATLGATREGSGVVIGPDDLVLTIGYLILEAEQVLLRTHDAREFPARVVAYDVATGFGLVRALVPMQLAPAPLGRSSELQADEPLMIASGGEDAGVSVARIVARRPFTGYWEYHLDEALYTAPARDDHSGAGLFDGRGQLVGIGSLLVGNVLGAAQTRLPGNVFVPLDLLPPILGELKEKGSSRASGRAWLGINCTETEGGVRVLRVSPDSPADIAGLGVGDTVLAIDGAEVKSLADLWKRLWTGGSAEREITLQILRGGERLAVTVNAVDRMKTLRRAQGV